MNELKRNWMHYPTEMARVLVIRAELDKLIDNNTNDIDDGDDDTRI